MRQINSSRQDHLDALALYAHYAETTARMRIEHGHISGQTSTTELISQLLAANSNNEIFPEDRKALSEAEERRRTKSVSIS